MPEPDLLPLVVTDAMLEGAKDRIPVLPRDSAVDLVKSYGGALLWCGVLCLIRRHLLNFKLGCFPAAFEPA